MLANLIRLCSDDGIKLVLNILDLRRALPRFVVVFSPLRCCMVRRRVEPRHSLRRFAVGLAPGHALRRLAVGGRLAPELKPFLFLW